MSQALRNSLFAESEDSTSEDENQEEIQEEHRTGGSREKEEEEGQEGQQGQKGQEGEQGKQGSEEEENNGIPANNDSDSDGDGGNEYVQPGRWCLPRYVGKCPHCWISLSHPNPRQEKVFVGCHKCHKTCIMHRQRGTYKGTITQCERMWASLERM